MRKSVSTVLALALVMALGASAHAANIDWNFWHDGSGDPNGWTVVKGGAHYRAGDGDGVTPDNGSGGRGYDNDQVETLLMQSPAFTFYGDGGTTDGTNAMIWRTSGGAGNQSSTPAPANPTAVINYNSGVPNSTGQKGLAFLNTGTGAYDAVLFNQGDGGNDTYNLTTTDLTNAGVDLTKEYRLHYYENDSGGWGWGQLNSVQIATNADPVPATKPKFLARGGAGGTYSAYESDSASRTWDAARVNAADSTLGYVKGHLVTIGSAEENALVQRHLGNGDRWIGLTDSTHTSSLDGTDLSTLGTSEQGNRGGSPIPVSTLPAAGQRGEGFQWITGEPLTYSFWGNGEPNDSGNEDVALIRNDGMWNDHNGGSTLIGGGQSDHQLASVIEYNLGTADLGRVYAPGFIIKVIEAGDGGLGGMIDVHSLIATQGAPGTTIGGPTSVALADFYQDSNGPFSVNNPFPGRGQGGNIDDNAAMLANGTLTVAAAGNYQFRIQGDDGGRLRIDGQDILLDDNPHGFGGPTSQNIFLTAGTHTYEWVNFEIGGGWGAEFTYSNGGSFVLVGDASQGIVATISAITLKSVNAGDINNIARAEQLLAGQLQAQDGTPLMGIASVIDFLEGGGNGRFDNDFDFLGVNGDDYILEATGVVFIPQAGNWTFGTNSDDGTLLTIGGVDKVHDRTGGPEDNFKVYNFATAGWHDIRLLFFERAGGAEVELFAAQGNFNSWGDTETWRLVGDTPNDGLRVMTTVPEPMTMLAVGMGIAGLGGYVRKRRRA